ncbi:MAG: diguanylate cyclase, partial [Proteobacteria bacterium]
YDLGALLHMAIGHLQCRFGVLLVPEKNVMLARHAPGGDEAKHRQALAATHRHLLGLAQHRAGALVLNEVPQADGREPVPYRIVTCAVRYPTGRPMGVLALYRDLAEPEFVDREAQLLDLLARRAVSIIQVSYDSLTGLMNRTAFEQRVRVVTSGRDGHWSLLYLDVDQLHVINDNCGMHTGDRVIAQIGALVRTLLVPNAQAARLSGDRIVVLLPTDLEAARGFAEAVRQGVTGVQAGSLDRGNDAHPLVSVSIGVAPMRGGEEFSHVAVIAETACKAAKDRGRNRVEVYRTSDASLVRRYEDVNIIPNLRVAMSENRLRLDAQLIVPMQASTSARWHFELLLRMIDGNGQTVGPDRFLSAAVRYQLMPMIDRWVVEHAISLLREHRQLLES